MKALILTKADGPDSTEVSDVESPLPAEGQVRVALRSAALNHRELWITRGRYPGMQLPAVLGCDGAGIVESVGAGVEASLIGNEVALYPGINWGADDRLPGQNFALLGMPGPGTIAEFITVSAQNIVAKPRHLSFDEAAAVPLAALTAWRGLITKARLAPGEKVLITGAGGGVAVAAVSLAVALGAVVYVTSGSDATLERAKMLGAREGINYTDPNWRKAVSATTRGIDVVFDGAPASSVGNYVRALNAGARVVIYGSTGGAQFTLNAPDLFLRNIELMGTNVGNLRELTEALKFMERHDIHPQIDARFTLSEAKQALQHLDPKHRFGKVVVTIA